MDRFAPCGEVRQLSCEFQCNSCAVGTARDRGRPQRRAAVGCAPPDRAQCEPGIGEPGAQPVDCGEPTGRLSPATMARKACGAESCGRGALTA